MHGNNIVDSSYEINEYRPYMARLTMMVFTMSELPTSGTAWSRNLGRHAGLCSLLISGLCESLSLSVGMIQILIARLYTGVEHLNYACHP